MKFGSEKKRALHRQCWEIERAHGIDAVKERVGYANLDRYAKRFVTEYIQMRTGAMKPKSDRQTRAQAMSFLVGQLITTRHSAQRAAQALQFERDSDPSDRTILNDATAHELLGLAAQLSLASQSVEIIQRHFRNHATGKQNLRRSSDQQQEG